MLEFSARHGLISAGDHVLTAVSGGPDSTALVCLLDHLRGPLAIGRITIVHFNHGLRGAESDADSAFVRSLGERLHLPVVCGEEDVRRHRRGRTISLEMAARARRHRFFQEALARCSAQKIALGHTANDQAEEVLLRLIRGSGPSGLEGMRAAGERNLVRPLLFATRQEILAYLQDLNMPFREDSSNLEPVCQRNVLRLHVFPLLEEHFHPRVVGTLFRHTRLVAEEEDWWSGRMDDLWPEVCLSETEGCIDLDREALAGLHPALLRRVLRRAVERFRGHLMGISTAHILALCRLAAGEESGRSVHLPGGLRATTEGLRILLRLASDASVQPPPALEELVVPSPGRYDYAGLKVDIRAEPPPPPGGDAIPASTPGTARMDAAKILWPMVLRPWKPGDRFQPLGLPGTKKLQDFFTDSKIPRAERHLVPILCDREKICWVVGRRLDDRVKVTSQTKEIIVVRLV